MTAAELERRTVEAFGPDFRDKAIVGPLGTFRLADAFAECGLEDPRQRSGSTGFGLMQFASVTMAKRSSRDA